MMFIKGILSTAAQLARLGRSGKPAESVPSASSCGNATPSPAGLPASDAMRQVLAGYDVTNISPRGFSEMLQRLRQAGALSEQDYQGLSSIRTDLEYDGTDPDQRVNLLDLYAKRVASMRGPLGGSQRAATQQAAGASGQRQLEWLQKFARLHAGQSPLGFDTLA